MQKGIVKGLAVVAVSMMCADAMAIAPGFYMGLMMGPASNTGSEQQMQYRDYSLIPEGGLPNSIYPNAQSSLANPQSTQFGSRLFLGYKFNHYAGFEMGFTYFSGIQYKFADKTLTPAAGTTGRVRGIDFVGKLDYSYNNTIGVFAKGGVTALYTTTPGALNVTNFKDLTDYSPSAVNPKTGLPNYNYINSGSNTYAVKLAPTFAVGASYDLDQSWQLDASWTRYFAGGSLKGMDLYALGLSYHFVDVYCGQFLCAN